MRKVSIGVIGTGHWSKNHLRNFDALGSLAAFSDVDDEKVRGFGEVFRGKYLDFLTDAHRKDELRMPGRDGLDGSRAFECLKTSLRSNNWVVYTTGPFAGAGQVLAYLGRYTHKTAIGNHRLVEFDGEHVRFPWRDYADGNKAKVMRLDADEFIRRFLLHVLPREASLGFARYEIGAPIVPHLASLSVFRAMLDLPDPEPFEPLTTHEMMLRLTGIDITVCRQCRKGPLRQILILDRRLQTLMRATETGLSVPRRSATPSDALVAALIPSFGEPSAAYRCSVKEISSERTEAVAAPQLWAINPTALI